MHFENKTLDEIIQLLILKVLDLLRFSTPALPNNLLNRRTLLLGEGNFSFGYSILKLGLIDPDMLVATTIKSKTELSSQAQQNVFKIQSLGGLVLFNVNAMNIDKKFGASKFHQIIFQFPNAANRSSMWGKTSNHFLVRRFLVSCIKNLTENGRIYISIVDSPYYFGSFQLTRAAKKANLKL
ncbi:MAG: Rossmann-like fold-containing protein [Parvibaculales bacterium]